MTPSVSLLQSEETSATTNVASEAKITVTDLKCQKTFAQIKCFLSSLGVAAFGSTAFGLLGTTLPIWSIALSVAACGIFAIACGYLFIDSCRTALNKIEEFQGPNGDFFQAEITCMKYLGEGNEGSLQKVTILSTHEGFGPGQSTQSIALKTLTTPDREEARQSRGDMAAMALNSPYIIQTLGVQTDTDQEQTHTTKVLMETFDSARSIQNRRIPTEEIPRLAKEIGMGIQHMHEQGLVHRDLKNENILIYDDQRGQMHAKIIDFGFARNLNRSQDPEVTGKELFRLTSCGSPFHLAPEIIQQQKMTRENHLKRDVFAFGILLYNMVFNKYPGGQGVLKTYTRSALISNLSSLTDMKLKTVLEKALTFDYLHRPTIQELLALPYFTEQTPEQIGGAE